MAIAMVLIGLLVWTTQASAGGCSAPTSVEPAESVAELATDFSDASTADCSVVTVGSSLSSATPLSEAGNDLSVPANASVTLDLAGQELNLADADADDAGIEVPTGSSLTIADSVSGGSLIVAGGSLAAGLGGDPDESAGTITIENDATVTSTGGFRAAAIGGGSASSTDAPGGDGGPLTVEDQASVTANGGLDAAAIGGGFGFGTGGAGGPVTVEDNATVTATGGSFAAGIGGGTTFTSGYVGGSGGSLTVEGDARVTATGGQGAAGVGGGYSGGGAGGAGGSLILQDHAAVTATGGLEAAAIGGGCGNTIGGAGGSVTLQDDATLSATGGINGAGIGGAAGVGSGPGPDGGAGGSLDIEGDASVTAAGGPGAAGVGGGYGYSADGGAGGSVIIGTGASLTATAGSSSVAIGPGANTGPSEVVNSSDFGSLTVDGTLTIPSGSPLEIPSGITVNADGTLNDQGNVQNAGSWNEGTDGSVLDDGTLENSGTLQAPVRDTVDIGGTLTNQSAGSISLGSDSSLVNDPAGTLTDNGTITVGASATAQNKGTWTESGTLTGSGSLTNDSSITLGTGAMVDDKLHSQPLTISEHAYGLTFNVNGGTASTPSELFVYAPTVAASAQTLPTLSSVPAGESFAGWFTAPTGGIQITNSTQLATALTQDPTGDPVNTTIYAQYLTPATIGTQPQPDNVQVGENATFTASATGGPAPTVTWQSCPVSDPSSCASGSSGWTPVATDITTTTGSTGTSSTLTVPNVTSADSGIEYRAVFTNTVGALTAQVTTNTAALTVVAAPSVSVASSVSVTAPTAKVFGQQATATATVSEADSSAASGTVQFAVDGDHVGPAIPVGPAGQVTSEDLTSGGILAAGNHTVTASFTPSNPAADEPASGAAQLTIAPAATATTVTVNPQSISATVSVTGAGAGSPSGGVSFTVAGTPVGTAPVVDGVATLAYSVPAGETQQVSAVYAGDTDFTGSSGSTSRSDPSIIGKLSSAKPITRFGWYASAVTVTFTCQASTAPLSAPCPSPVTLSRSGANQTVTRSITSTDGGAATVTVRSIDIDLGKPTVGITGVRNHGVYRGTAPTPGCVARDAISSIASCKLTLSRHSSSKGLDITTVKYRAVATNRAGTTQTVVGSYQVLGIYLQPAPYKNGAFQIQPGRTYTLVVTHSTSQPSYVYAAPAPLPPSGGGPRFYPAGHDRWLVGVMIMNHLFHPYETWVLGIKTGSTLHQVTIRNGG